MVERQWKLAVFTLGLVAGVSGAPASGTLVGIRFAGTIDFVEATLPFSDLISAGMPFQGTYSFDSDAPDIAPDDPTYGAFSFPDHAMSVRIGLLTFTSSDLAIGISNYSYADRYLVRNLSSFDANGANWAFVFVTLSDLSATALSGDALTIQPPNLDDFQLKGFGLTRVGHLQPSIRGTVTSLTLIPEPGTLALLVTGAVCVANRRRSLERPEGPRFG